MATGSRPSRIVALLCATTAAASLGLAALTVPARAQAPTTVPPTTVPPTTVAVPQPASDPSVVGVPFDPVPGDRRPTRVRVDGPAVELATEQAASFVFDATAGQSLAITANRSWQVTGPLGTVVAQGEPFVAHDSGRYLVAVGPGLLPPASVRVYSVDPAAVVHRPAVGQPFAFSTSETRTQFAVVHVLGGQRYRLRVPSGPVGSSVCAEDWTGTRKVPIACVPANPPGAPDAGASFVLGRDLDVVLTAHVSTRGPQGELPASVPAVVEVLDNDLVVDPGPNGVVEALAKPGQRIVVPFWGSPAERAVLSTAVEADAAAWGEPWIDKEERPDGPGSATSKVFATPIVFDPGKAPFVAWSDTVTPKRYGVYRGEDTAATVATDGVPVVIRNRPWFASVAAVQLEAGQRYAIQVTGTSLRPISLAVRDPSGKFSANLSPWQWTQDGDQQRALTTVSVDRGGGWALELRPSGNAVRDVAVSVAKVGSGASYQGAVDVADVLTVGEKTDVQLGPNEFARFSVKLASATPQIIQPEVLRYRNTTFQPTAADLSLWDARGRLVWSNNRNLEEEVLSGRLGREPQLSERFATVASAEPYTLIVSPKTDIAGRFRVSVTSTPVFSDVRLGGGAIPVLPGGTRTGVVEVRAPTRYRLTGTSACVTVTSLAEWGGGPRCIADGRTLSFPPGVHRLSFAQPVSQAASFTAVAAGAPPDPVVTAGATIDGAPAELPRGAGDAVIPFDVPSAGTRLVFGTGRALFNATVVLPDGDRRPATGIFVAVQPGPHRLLTTLFPDRPQTITIRRAPTEVQPVAIGFGATFRVYRMQWGQRIEATVNVPKRSRFTLDTLADPNDPQASIAFVYAASAAEQRYGEGSVLPAGRYRFVFVGQGLVRIAIRPLPVA